jgi:signal transduction histidine kinase
MTQWFSLRRRLLAPILAGVTAAWLAAGIWVFVEVRHELHDLLHERTHDERDEHGRRELIAGIAGRLTAPLIFGLPLMGFWIWLATWRGLKPLDAVAREIAARQPEKLEPVTPASAPSEVRPLVEAINGLFVRVEHALESERRFTADAAHELRTPLAALAAQAQVVQRARDAGERDHAIEQLIASTRRASRLVDQLLTLARLDPDNAAVSETVSLDRLAENVCAAHGAEAMEKNIALELDAVSATIAGNADMLRILLRNLIDNAIRYTSAGGRVTVAVAPGILSVTDTGPGIPAAEHERVFNRFHRLAGQDTEGSGLGLSIVARIAERHGASVELGTGENGKGLRVTVRFSARPVPAGAS